MKRRPKVMNMWLLRLGKQFERLYLRIINLNAPKLLKYTCSWACLVHHFHFSDGPVGTGHHNILLPKILNSGADDELQSSCDQCVCLTNFIWRSSSNPKCHMTFSINKNECQVTLTFSSKISPQCSMPSNTCHSQFVKCQKLVFSFTSHTTCQNLKCACQLTCILFVCEFLRVKYWKVAKHLSKIHTAWDDIAQGCSFDALT